MVLLTCTLSLSTAFAQAPEKMSYQAVIRNASNALVTSQGVGIQVSILKGGASGTAVFVETHNVITNINGLVTLEIGTGTLVSGNFTTIDWAADTYFIQTETDPTTAGGTNYTITGTTQLMSVPYALHAKTAENVTGTVNYTETDPTFTAWDKSSGIVITESQISDLTHTVDTDTHIDSVGITALGFNAGGIVTEVDGSVTNEIQALSMSNDTLYLSSGGFVKLPAGFDGQYSSLTGAPTNVSTFNNDVGYLITEIDSSITNEIQALSISNDTVYLSDGGFVKLPTVDGSETQVTAGTNVTVTGTGTTASPYVVAATQAPGTTAGEMLYWNGTAWVNVAPGTAGQVLTFDNGVPTWKTTVGPTDVYNPTTGKIWMDRNLGASQVATSSTDTAAYGDLYQWGRGSDGHQLRTSATTTTLSTTNVPGHSSFIIASNSDWRNPHNTNLWQGVSGINNPCPAGYRIPTDTEWEAERASWSSNNAAGAFASLKLTFTGHRVGPNGALGGVGTNGFYWSSTVIYVHAAVLLVFGTSGSAMGSDPRNYGTSVRCIKN